MSVTLREAGLEDREQLGQLLAEYLFELDGNTEPYPYLGAYWVEPERLPFVIEEDGEVVGLCLIRVREGGWDIAEFSVTPDRRRSGIGRAAVEAIVARAREEGASHLQAKVHTGNRDALSFWLAVGFREYAERGVIVTRRRL